MKKYTIGQVVNYTNGSLSIYTGVIVSITNNGNQLVVIDGKAGMELWNAGYAVGSCIHPNQIKDAERLEREAESNFFKSHPELNP